MAEPAPASSTPSPLAAATACEPVLRRVRDCALLAGLAPEAVASLAAEADWFSLPGGRALDREGDNDQALFLVLTGALGVMVPNERGEDVLVARIGAGETVGEMALISGEPHSAGLVALRDSELLRLSKAQFNRLCAEHPDVLLNLSRQLVRRLRDTTRRAAARTQPRTFALVPLGPAPALPDLVAALARRLSEMGLRTIRVGAEAQTQSSEWFHALEAGHDVVLYHATDPASGWAQLCLRQADRLIVVADAACEAHWPASGAQADTAPAVRASDAVLLHPGTHVSEGAGARLMARLPAAHLHHVRRFDGRDIGRLARFLAGRAVAVVLAGGGARGFAHLGVLEALVEMRVPIDLAAGSSMGAVVAAGLAMEWDLLELTQRIKAAFVDTNPLSDYTLPLVALLRGRKVSGLLRAHFGERQIEDCGLGFFCVSSNLTAGHTHVHRSGPMWRALRASVAIPGILPPVIDQGQVLVDGGLMNNFPVDVMADAARGPIIGIDVTGEPKLTAAADLTDTSVWTLLRERMKGRPSILSILMRSGTVGNEHQRRRARGMADLLFDPPMPGVGLQTWRAFDAAIEAGYTHAVDIIQRDGLPPALKAACA